MSSGSGGVSVAEDVPIRTSGLERFVDGIARRLSLADIDNPRAEAVRLLQAVLMAAERGGADSGIAEAVERAVQQREQRRSIARIVGQKRFRTITVHLADGVFEPCESSEVLVEHAVAHCEDRGGPVRILDLGTGCGNLLLAALNEMPQATGVGVDISPEAVDLASSNARRLGLDKRARFEVGDVAESCEGSFDLVLSNLPFLPTRVIPTLAPEIVLYDPPRALDGGRDGYDCYRTVATEIRKMTQPGSLGLFQLSREFIEGAKSIFIKEGHRQVTALKDHYGLPIGVSVRFGG
jgi:release factor glutamine methyltransferase